MSRSLSRGALGLRARVLIRKDSSRVCPNWRLGQSAACFVLVMLCAGGCGGSKNNLGRLPISGTVTLDGVPLKSGHIVFEPSAGQPTQSGGMIYDGKFDVPEAQGAAPGLYTVAVYAGEEATAIKFEPGTPEYEAAAMKAKSSGERVPRNYNIDTELSAEVKVDGENFFPFELVSQKNK